MTSFLALGLMLANEPNGALSLSRLALTPVLDGVIAVEEWDSFTVSRSATTFLQWEPGLVHLAAEVTEGEDLIISLDTAGDGWLVGQDNTEIRFSKSDSGATISVRKLDATRREGPVWVPASDRGITIATSEVEGKWVVEASIALDEKRVAKEGSVLGISMEAAPTEADLGPAFLPRSLDFINLSYDRSEGLPTGLTWKSETKLREVAREDSLKMRFSLNGNGAFYQVQMRCEGQVKNDLSSLADPFNGFDNKGKANFEYSSSIAPNSAAGWHVVRATLIGANGEESVLRTSFKLSELIEFDVSLPESIEFSKEQQTLKGNVYLRSTGLGRVEGKYTINTPQSWTIERGGDEKFAIYHPRGRDQIGLKFIIPAGAVGEYPVTFTAQIGQKQISKTVTIRIDPPTE